MTNHMEYHMSMGRREVLVQLDDELIERLAQIAEAQGTSRSALLRRGARAVIEAEELAAADAELIDSYRRQPPDPAPGPVSDPTRGPNRTSVVARNQIYWSDLGPPAGRRPVCVLTRDAATTVLNAVTCAPITRTIRGNRSEVEIGTDEGLPTPCVITCDNIITIPIAQLDPRTRRPTRCPQTSPNSTKPSDTPSISSTNLAQPADIV